MNNMLYRNASFDLVICNNLLEHLGNESSKSMDSFLFGGGCISSKKGGSQCSAGVQELTL